VTAKDFDLCHTLTHTHEKYLTILCKHQSAGKIGVFFSVTKKVSTH